MMRQNQQKNNSLLNYYTQACGTTKANFFNHPPDPPKADMKAAKI
jgi:hypothetical protein